MKNRSLAFTILASTLFAGCSGGGPPGGGSLAMMPIATAPSTATTTLATATIAGNLVFVNSASLPVYTFSSDPSSASLCTAGCLAAWPAVSPPAAALSTGFSTFKRSDNGATQLAYNGKPLYTFVGDSADTATGAGDVVPDNGSSGATGTFELTLATTSATSAPSSAPTSAPPTSAPYSTRRSN